MQDHMDKTEKFNLDQRRYLRYSIFSIIYLHQGFIEVFIYIYMALYLLSFGLSIVLIGLTIAIAGSPWVIKIFYGILSDRKGFRKWGRRLPYMTVSSFFAAVFFFVIIPINPGTSWLLFTTIITIGYLFNAVCDTATDGLVVDTTLPEKRGTVQSICWGSKLIGYVVASIMVGFMIQIFSWTVYFIFMGFFLLLPIPLLIIAKESPYSIPEKFPWKDFKETFKRRIVWIILLFFIIIEFGIYIIFAMMPLFLTLELKLDLSLVGIVMAGGSFGFFIGCLVSGPIFDRLSRKMGITISIIILIVAFFLVSLIQNFLMALIFVLLTGLAWGLFQIIQNIISMDITKKSISATMFSIFMSLYNLGQLLGALFGAILVTTFGFRLAFILAAIIVLPTLLLTLLIKRTEEFNIETSEAVVK